MLTIKIKSDEEIIKGRSYEELVLKMNMSQMSPQPSIEEYIKCICRRVLDAFNITLVKYSCEEFIVSLGKTGLVEIL